ncbi:MAG: hypothetical protein ACEPOZ_18300 [Marinifilaceae bacterium]|jgi:hypothetical protein
MFNLSSKFKKRPGMWPYVFEFFTVLLSVYLAFLITEWREQHKLKKDVKMAMERLNLEIFRNYETMIDFHEEVTHRLEKMQEIERIWTPDRNFSSYVSIFGGYQIAKFKQAAWNRVSSSELANMMPVEYVERVHNLYEGANGLVKHNDMINKVLYSSMLTDPKQSKTAHSLSELFTWQQSIWAMLQERYYRKFISEYRPYFEEYLQQDSLINAKFMEQDTLTPEQLNQYTRNKRLYLNSLRGWNSEKPRENLAIKK